MLRDENYRPGSEADQARRELFSDTEGYNSANQGQEINPDPGLYDSASDFQIPSANSGYDSPNKYGYSGREYRAARKAARRDELMDRARKIAGNRVLRQGAKALGMDTDALKGDGSMLRNKATEMAKKKARKLAQDKIGKKLADKGLRKGFSKGLSKGAAKTGKEAAKRLGKAAGKTAAKGAAKVGAKVGAQVGVKGTQAVVTAAGVGTGAATFGLGFLLSILVNIAISLGISDAVDAAFELTSGNFKKARFLFIRAGAKVGFFIFFLLAVLSLASVGGLILGIPLLIAMNLYMISGMVFKNVAILQGVVWWEKITIIIVDAFAFILTLTFILALGYYLCTSTGLGSGGVTGTALSAVVAVYDWWNETSAGSVAQDFCKYVHESGNQGTDSSATNTSTATSNSNTAASNSNTNSSGP